MRAAWFRRSPLAAGYESRDVAPCLMRLLVSDCRVAKRRSELAKELIKQRGEGKRLSQIRRESWDVPKKARVD